MGMRLRRLKYYLSSAVTILTEVQNWPLFVWSFLGLPIRKPFIIRLKRSGARFKVRNPMDVWVVKETYLDKGYEQYGTPLQPGWTVIDIGGGIGDFSVFAARERGCAAVYTYEPFPESFALLQDNLELNHVKTVRAFPYAVAGKAGIRALDTTQKEPGQFRTTGTHVPAGPGSVQVYSLTLAEIMAGLQTGGCHFLKMDCEGAEYEIFFNTEAGSLERIQHICLEYHDHVTQFSHVDLVRFFRERGFSVKLLPSSVQPHIGFIYAQNPNWAANRADEPLSASQRRSGC